MHLTAVPTSRSRESHFWGGSWRETAQAEVLEVVETWKIRLGGTGQEARRLRARGDSAKGKKLCCINFSLFPLLPVELRFSPPCLDGPASFLTYYFCTEDVSCTLHVLRFTSPTAALHTQGSEEKKRDVANPESQRISPCPICQLRLAFLLFPLSLHSILTCATRSAAENK